MKLCSKLCNYLSIERPEVSEYPSYSKSGNIFGNFSVYHLPLLVILVIACARDLPTPNTRFFLYFNFLRAARLFGNGPVITRSNASGFTPPVTAAIFVFLLDIVGWGRGRAPSSQYHLARKFVSFRNSFSPVITRSWCQSHHLFRKRSDDKLIDRFTRELFTWRNENGSSTGAETSAQQNIILPALPLCHRSPAKPPPPSPSPVIN